jgi:serine/threonine protein phosphatase 1
MIVYCIGDIHGCNDKLQMLLDKIYLDMKFYPGSMFELVFIGDYIDRGPDSSGVINTILSLMETDTFSKVVTIRGNHEQMLLDALDGDFSAYRDFISNGGKETLQSYGNVDSNKLSFSMIPEDHINFFRNTKLYYQIDNLVCVHAGVDPTIPLEEQSEHTLVWSRKFNVYNGLYTDGKYVVHGHTPVPGPHRLTAQVNIDTGAVFGGKLTACVINTTGTFGNCRIIQT